MKKAENSEKHPEIWKRVFSCMKNQDGASLMAALLFFVFCGVGASIILASASVKRTNTPPPRNVSGNPESSGRRSEAVCGGLGGGISAG